MIPYVDESKCTGCGVCQNTCPGDPCVFEVNDKAKVVHPEGCIECGACEDSCPQGAIKLKD